MKTILVVDDDKFILTFLEHTLKKFAPDYQITTVLNGPQALEKLQVQTYDLLITDYLMPGLSGVDLANAVRHMNPSTAIVLMTAYATDQLNHTVELLHVDGYIRKPLNLAQIRNVIHNLIGADATPKKKAQEPVDQEQLQQEVRKHLETLHTNTGARFAVLVNAGGDVVNFVGPAEVKEVRQIAMLTAANFQTARQLTRLVDSQPSYKSGSFEASDYDIYAYNINPEFHLAVASSKDTRQGIVWIYTKQAAESLLSLVKLFPADQFLPTLQLDLSLTQLNNNGH